MSEEIEKFPLLKNASGLEVHVGNQMEELHYIVEGTLYGDDITAFLDALKLLKSKKKIGIPNKGY